MKIQKDTADFLAAMLFGQSEDAEINDQTGHTIHDFSPEFIDGVTEFVSGFRAFLDKEGFDSERLDFLRREFGGNVFFSLSGHGVGFWDENDDAGKEVDDLLVKYSGSKHRFEHFDLSEHEDGKIDLAFLPEYLPDYRAKMFSVSA